MAVKASEYNLLFKGPHGMTHLFNFCTRALVTLDQRAEQVYRDLMQGKPVTDPTMFAELLRGRFAVPAEIDERAWIRTSYYAARFVQHNLGLTIAPTLRCNFGCSYCFEDPGGATDMDARTMEDLCAFVKFLMPRMRTVGITWYGGEPTLRIDIIRTLSRRFRSICQENNVRYGAGMITNGYLLDQLTDEDFKELALGSIQITIDGPRDVHNSRRPLRGGGDTYDRIIRNVKRIAILNRCQVSLRVNVDQLNVSYVRSLLLDLKGHGLDEHPSVIVNLAPVHALSKFCRNIDHHCLAPSQYSAIEPDLYIEAARSGFPYACYPITPWGTCGATRLHAYVVDPDGHLQKCWNTVGHPDKRVGHISDLKLAEPLLHTGTPLLQRWLNWDPLQTDCSQCRYFPLCQGGCPFKSLYPDEVREISSNQCSRWRFNLEAALNGFLACKTEGLRTAVLRSERPGGSANKERKEVSA